MGTSAKPKAKAVSLVAAVVPPGVEELAEAASKPRPLLGPGEQHPLGHWSEATDRFLAKGGGWRRGCRRLRRSGRLWGVRPC